MSVLPIPELMPFRLTQQMLGVLEPLDAKVLLRNPMSQVMTALRGGRDVLQASWGYLLLVHQIVSWLAAIGAWWPLHRRAFFSQRGEKLA